METGTVLITRFEPKNKNEEDFTQFNSWLSNINSKRIEEILIICNDDDKKKIKNLKYYDKNKMKFITHCKPTSPTAMNIAIKKLSKKTQFFIIASKEIVNIEEKVIEKLILEIDGNRKLLVVGYKFEIKNDSRLNKELQDYYKNQDLIAYKVPWNTCAIWSRELFDKHVLEFDRITSNSPFCDICVCINNVCSKTPHEGMEDGLAIAKASSETKGEICYKLLNKEKALSWKVDVNDYNKKLKHRQKLARKDTVLRNFMAVRGYSVEDLKNAKRE